MDSGCQQQEFRYKIDLVESLFCFSVILTFGIMVAEVLYVWHDTPECVSGRDMVGLLRSSVLATVFMLLATLMLVSNILKARRAMVTIDANSLTVTYWTGKKIIVMLNSISLLKLKSISIPPKTRFGTATVVTAEGEAVQIEMPSDGDKLIECICSQAGLTESHTDRRYTYFTRAVENAAD